MGRMGEFFAFLLWDQEQDGVCATVRAHLRLDDGWIGVVRWWSWRARARGRSETKKMDKITRFRFRALGNFGGKNRIEACYCPHSPAELTFAIHFDD